VTAAAVAAVLVGAGAMGASASLPACASPPPPEAIVTGTARTPAQAPYLQAGDYAVIARVKAVNLLHEPIPVPDSSGPKNLNVRSGPEFEVRVTALAYFAGPTLGPELRFTLYTPNILGYSFERGRTYFIPVQNDGDLDIGSACSAITLLPDAGPALEQEITRLITTATAKGVPATRVTPQGGAGQAVGASTAPQSGNESRALDLGDLPTWIASIAALAALGFSLWTWVSTRRRNREADERAQAQKVAAWVHGRAVMVRNASSAPIWDTRLVCYDGNDPLGLITVADNLPLSAVPPGATVKLTGSTHARPTLGESVAVIFRDVMGVDWTRAHDGRLSKGTIDIDEGLPVVGQLDDSSIEFT
jgi:hypothetical protein